MNRAEAVDHIRPAAVQISFHATGLSDEAREQVGRPFVAAPLGTGFFVNADGYVVTARHVLEAGRQAAERIQADQKDTVVGLAQPNTENMRGNFSIVPFDVVDEDARHDLALLRLKANPFAGEVRSGIVVGDKEVPVLFGTATLNDGRPSDGEAVGISGYPLGQPVLVTNAGWMATSWSFDIQEVAVPEAPEWFRRPDIADTFLADVEVNPGNSGGPVYLAEDASVIGVCRGSLLSPVRDQQGNVDSRRLHYSSGLTIVVPARYVIELLRKHGLNWSQPKLPARGWLARLLPRLRGRF